MVYPEEEELATDSGASSGSTEARGECAVPDWKCAFQRIMSPMRSNSVFITTATKSHRSLRSKAALVSEG